MTILYILHSTDPAAGATKSFLLLLTGVLRAGHKAIVVVPEQTGIYDTLLRMGVEVLVEPSKPNTWTSAWNLRQTLLYIPRQLGRLLINRRATRHLRNKLAGTHIDLVHSNSSVIGIGQRIARAYGLPHIFHIREYGDKDFSLTYFPSNRAFYRLLRAEDVYSICITRDVQRHFGLTGLSSSRVIYNGVASPSSFPSEAQAPRSFFLYAGRLEQTKGLADLVEAYNLYTQRVDHPLPLKVAGETVDPAYEQQVRQRLEQYGLTSRVEFLGKVNDMDSLYKNALATIIPSYFEGFGRCMPEAMAHGSIVIGRNTGGTQEQFDNGLAQENAEIGLRFTALPELADCLMRVHTMSEGDRRQLVEHARHCVSALYTTDTYVNNILNFYQDILKK